MNFTKINQVELDRLRSLLETMDPTLVDNLHLIFAPKLEYLMREFTLDFSADVFAVVKDAFAHVKEIEFPKVIDPRECQNLLDNCQTILDHVVIGTLLHFVIKKSLADSRINIINTKTNDEKYIHQTNDFVEGILDFILDTPGVKFQDLQKMLLIYYLSPI